jgi:phage protein U
MSNLVVARLGDIEFSLPEGSFTQIERRTSWRVDVPDPITGLGTPDVRGRASDELRLTGAVFPGISGHLDSVDRLRDAGDAGEPLLLVDGEGTIYGEWVVSSVEESRQEHLPTGIPRKMSWVLVLVAKPEES